MIRIATRRSRLARIQAEAARQALHAAHPRRQFELLPLTTSGDRFAEVSLEQVEGKGFFTDALERSLAGGEAQIATHSLKDLPVDLDPRFQVSAVLQRGDPRDVLLSTGADLEHLAEGAVVGTDSSRRRCQLNLVRPDLRVVPIRGNVPTRIAKLDRGEYDAIVLAAAGLERLGLLDRVTQFLDPEVCLPAPGQGAIALETLSESPWAEMARTVDHEESALAVGAERAFLAVLGGGCRMPIGCLAEVSGGQMRFRGVVVDSGQGARVDLEGPADRAFELGRAAAERLLAEAALP